MTRIAVLIPDRGDRTFFLHNCYRMMDRQTLLPVRMLIFNNPPRDEKIDLGWRYKIGYEMLSKDNIDLIALIENDDFYHPEYLETMAHEWEERGRPMLLGIDYTIYYHLKLKKYFYFKHYSRSSAMCTVIRPNIPNIDWGPEHDPYTDMHLWTKVGLVPGDRIIFHPDNPICIGMKGHGVGKTGGVFHDKDLERFDMEDVIDDQDGKFLEQTIGQVDAEGLQFYKQYQ